MKNVSKGMICHNLKCQNEEKCEMSNFLHLALASIQNVDFSPTFSVDRTNNNAKCKNAEHLK